MTQEHLLLLLQNKYHLLRREILHQAMYRSRDKTHNQNETTAKKDRIAKTPVIAGQRFITSKPL